MCHNIVSKSKRGKRRRVTQEAGVCAPPDTKQHEAFPDRIQVVVNPNQTFPMFSQIERHLIFLIKDVLCVALTEPE